MPRPIHSQIRQPEQQQNPFLTPLYIAVSGQYSNVTFGTPMLGAKCHEMGVTSPKYAWVLYG